MTKEEKLNFCQIIGTLLVSDLELHDAEVHYLEDLYRRLGVTPEERVEIESSINLRDDVTALARALSAEVRVELLKELNRAAWADGVLVAPETRIIMQIEELLNEDS